MLQRYGIQGMTRDEAAIAAGTLYCLDYMIVCHVVIFLFDLHQCTHCLENDA